jgi:hypothetical protein
MLAKKRLKYTFLNYSIELQKLDANDHHSSFNWYILVVSKCALVPHSILKSIGATF